MAIHSFADHHEIGEGYYEKAKTLKDGYTPDMIRANMTGLAYGFRAENNLKGGPLMVNQRLAALWVNGVEGRHGDFRFWRAGYEAHANPALGQLPSRLASGKAAADDRHLVLAHLEECRRKGEEERRKIWVFLCKKLRRKNLLLYSVQL